MTADAAAQARATARLVLLRHGETEWSRSGRHTSVTDLPLTDDGERQARAVGRAIGAHEFGLVLASPRRRARHTAELVGFGDRLQIDGDLAEWEYGAYEGVTSEQIVAELGHPWNLWHDGVPPGEIDGRRTGETAGDVQTRVTRVIARAQPVLDRGEDVLLVAHGHVLRALAAAWIALPATGGADLSLATGTVSELGFEHDRRVILRWNCPPEHLPEL